MLIWYTSTLGRCVEDIQKKIGLAAKYTVTTCYPLSIKGKGDQYDSNAASKHLVIQIFCNIFLTCRD